MKCQWNPIMGTLLTFFRTKFQCSFGGNLSPAKPILSRGRKTDNQIFSDLVVEQKRDKRLRKALLQLLLLQILQMADGVNNTTREHSY